MTLMDTQAKTFWSVLAFLFPPEMPFPVASWGKGGDSLVSLLRRYEYH